MNAISYYNLKDSGLFVNASGFILGFWLLAYAFYTKPNTATNDEKGTLYGMLIVFPILFILVNLSIRSDSLETQDE